MFLFLANLDSGSTIPGSTNDAIIKMLDTIYIALHRNEYHIRYFTDLHKAFDRVDPNIPWGEC